MKTAKEWKLIKAHRCLKCGGKCKEDKTKRMVIGRFWYCPECDGKPVALTKRRAR
jgi:NAD-dependent SIR2 family protein deacetylase